MRIAHVTDCYRPRIGGIELHVHDLARHQRAAGHDVTVLTSTPGENAPGTKRFAAVMSDVPSLNGLAALRKALRNSHFDVVHAHVSSVSPFAWAAIRAASIPTAVTVHSMLSPRTARLTARLVGGSHRPITWTAVSQAAAAPLREALGAVGVLPNGIDADAWITPGRAPGPLTVVSVMRLTRRKRPRALLETLLAIRQRLDIPIQALIVGDGPERGYLERHRPEWVTLTGALTRDRVKDVLARADVFLAPAHRESFGIAALEARCAGLAVVGMASGGVGEFVCDGVEGFLVRDDLEMAEVTAGLLSSSRLRVVQDHNRTTRPALDWPETVERSLEVYHRAGVRELVTAR
jgi:glycosyltransferase involved in cell wall biosynthesis